MEFDEQLEHLKEDARRLTILQTEIRLRPDGTISTPLKIRNGAPEMQTNVPMKSIHLFEFENGKTLRIKKSNKDRKGHFAQLLQLLNESFSISEVKEQLMQMKGIEKGKNVHWKISWGDEKVDFDSLQQYLKKVKEDDSFVVEKPAVGDDLVLVGGWE